MSLCEAYSSWYVADDDAEPKSEV
ncbi:unnamed protein product [Lathyrus sativus]|nr:unnamed protein product [Lathyrus sativus]